MSKVEKKSKLFGSVCCAECDKEVAFFPVRSVPVEDLELYCPECKAKVEEAKR